MPDGTNVSSARSTTLLTLPNVITFARLCMVPMAVWFVLEHGLIEAFFVFLAAGLSDALDGWLARRNGGGNSVGALLDPVADKALLVSMYVTLAAVNELPDWLGMPVAIRPLYVSKLNTALQIVLVAVTLLLAGYGLQAPLAKLLLIWVVGMTTLASGAAYVWKAARGR